MPKVDLKKLQSQIMEERREVAAKIEELKAETQALQDNLSTLDEQIENIARTIDLIERRVQKPISPTENVVEQRSERSTSTKQPEKPEKIDDVPSMEKNTQVEKIKEKKPKLFGQVFGIADRILTTAFEGSKSPPQSLEEALDKAYNGEDWRTKRISNISIGDGCVSTFEADINLHSSSVIRNSIAKAAQNILLLKKTGGQPPSHFPGVAFNLDKLHRMVQEQDDFLEILRKWGIEITA